MAVRDDFAAGEVLAAADLNDTFASKVDYALPVNAQTGTTYTFVAADAEKLTTASNAAAVTLTIPPQSSVTWSDNTVLRVVNYGAGAVTIDGGSGVTVTNTSSTIAQYGAAVAIRTGSDAWTVVPFGGGDIPAAGVSSPAATGQYTDSGTTYDYYTFTSSGTLTVDTAGFADVLLVGGGGGGGNSGGGIAAGGGGAGGHFYLEDVYLNAGSNAVVVGAGGGGNGSGSNSSVALLSVGGGAGGYNGATGGSGGGGGAGTSFSGVGGAGTTGQGNSGGNGAVSRKGGGGGGAGAVGANAAGTGGNGGAGTANSITGSSVTRAGGGGGGSTGTPGTGGVGGGGNGGGNNSGGSAGTANTGGGGGGAADSNGVTYSGGSGGSGIVIVRVKV